MQEWVNMCKSINVIQLINKMRDKNHMTISRESEKSSMKVNINSWLKKKKKPLNKVGMEGTYLNLIPALYNNPTANIIFNSEKGKAFPLTSGIRWGWPLSPILLNKRDQDLGKFFLKCKRIEYVQILIERSQQGERKKTEKKEEMIPENVTGKGSMKQAGRFTLDKQGALLLQQNERENKGCGCS